MSGVNAEIITEFIDGFHTHKDHDIQKRTLKDYIEKQTQVGGLQEWTVCIFSNKKGNRIDLGNDDFVYSVKRTPTAPIDEGKIGFKQIIDPKHEAFDLTKDEKNRVSRTESGSMKPASIRAIRSHHRGLLLIYPLHNVGGDIDKQYDEQKLVELYKFPTS